MACEQLLASALKQGGAVFVRHGVLPAARQLTPRAFAALGIATLRSLDPGFELAGYIRRVGAARLMEVARQLQPALPTLGNVMSHVDARLPAAAAPGVCPGWSTRCPYWRWRPIPIAGRRFSCASTRTAAMFAGSNIH
ncbi:hypothetical protein SODG_003924 [Sodalis praecaptivus]